MLQQRSCPVVSCLMLFLAVWVVGSVVWAGDPGDYYGFGEMEILKLDWELGPPLAGDLNGNSLNDLVVYNNRRSRIELLLQRPGFDPQAAEIAPEPPRENINDIFGRELKWRFKRFHYPVHVRVTSLVLGDFNNDQRLDLAYYSAEGLHVVLQDRGQDAEGASGQAPFVARSASCEDPSIDERRATILRRLPICPGRPRSGLICGTGSGRPRP